VTFIEYLKLRGNGHTERLNNKKMTKQIVTAMLEGKVKKEDDHRKDGTMGLKRT
jgi:hypothetical protein